MTDVMPHKASTRIVVESHLYTPDNALRHKRYDEQFPDTLCKVAPRWPPPKPPIWRGALIVRADMIPTGTSLWGGSCIIPAPGRNGFDNEF